MTDYLKQPAVGIDLGTTFSAVAFLDADGKPETIRNSEGDLTTPSAVFFDHKRPIVGLEAVEAGLLEPDRLAQFAKRDVGEQYYEKQIGGKHLPAEVIQSLILRKLKADAELKLGPITKAVITVPAFFNEPCRKATQDAGRLAGLRVLDIINEPTAAAITYGVEHGFLKADGSSKTSETVLVYDLGGGTFDVTVMRIEKGHFHTIATAGDVYLGGIDWDGRMVDLIAEAFVAEHGIDPREDPQAEQELLRKANQTKHALTQRESVTMAFANSGRRLRTEITQQAFTDRCADLVERTMMTVRLVLDDAKITWDKITRLILVGGSTRMPMIRNELQKLSRMELDRSLSPDEAVSHGAALYAGMLMAGKNDRSGISVTNVNSHDLGVLAIDPKTAKPRRRVMIPRNSRLPASKMVRFRTHEDNQANVKIDIVEGGDDRGINATTIGKCIVDDLPTGTPKGTNVNVRFDYTPDGRLTVHASLPKINRKISMTLDRAAGLSRDDMKLWAKRLDDGLGDAGLAALPDISSLSGIALDEANLGELPDDSNVGSNEQEAASDRDAKPLPADQAEHPDFAELSPGKKAPRPAETPVTDQTPSTQETPVPALASNNAAAILNMTKKSRSERQPASDSSAAQKINIDVGSDAAPAERLDPNEARVVPVSDGPHRDEVVTEKPKLDLGPKDSAPVVNADPGDLAKLAALSDDKNKPAPIVTDIPTIVTGPTHNESTPIKPDVTSDVSNSTDPPKKSGGLFGRRKK